MAKGPFWLRGAKGKLAGSVIFKGESGTIVRENVKPRNPKTNAQMRQRVVWATITQAAKKMLPIIGISFEGVNSEKLNRRRFVQLNSTLFARHAQNPSMDNVCAWSGKGNNQLIPNPYILSRGTLIMPRQVLVPKFENDSIPTSTDAVTIPGGEHTALEYWKLMYGMEPGSQLTIPFITAKIDERGVAYSVNNSEGTRIDLIRYSMFYAPRIVLKEPAENDAKFQITAETTSEQLEAFLSTAVVSEKTATDLLGYFLEFAINPPTAGGDITINLDPDWEDLMLVYGSFVCACGAIYSKQDSNGIWRYTNCEMDSCRQNLIPSVQNYYGLYLRNAISTYKSEASRDANYLQTGGDGGDID